MTWSVEVPPPLQNYLRPVGVRCQTTIFCSRDHGCHLVVTQGPWSANICLVSNLMIRREWNITLGMRLPWSLTGQVAQIMLLKIRVKFVHYPSTCHSVHWPVMIWNWYVLELKVNTSHFQGPVRVKFQQATWPWNRGLVVRRLISAYLGFFFLCSKAFPRKIFSVIFKASNNQLVDKKN